MVLKIKRFNFFCIRVVFLRLLGVKLYDINFNAMYLNKFDPRILYYHLYDEYLQRKFVDIVQTEMLGLNIEIIWRPLSQSLSELNPIMF